MPPSRFLLSLLTLLSSACASLPREGDPDFPVGHFELDRRDPARILAAPHGGFDLDSEILVREASRRIGWSSIVAEGFRKRVHPINVNRPTEGIGLAPEEEKETPGARAVYAAWRKHLAEVAEPKPALYVEIHGEGGTESESPIEVATVGLEPDECARVREILVKFLHQERLPERIAVEGVDSIRFRATSAKQRGTLSEVPRALHIELPRIYRLELKAQTLRFLVGALPAVAEALKSASPVTSARRSSLPAR